MICPNCNIEMIGETYEPYEHVCTECGYWFDAWTGEVLYDVPHPIPDTQQELPGMAVTIRHGEPIQEWHVQPGFISVYTAKQPVECAVCHQIAAYDKTDAGYPGLYHCTACHAWVDKVHNEAWRYTWHDDEEYSEDA